MLRESRTVAVIGASPRPERHSAEVVAYLHDAGYDVIPVRTIGRRSRGLPTYATLADVGGRIDLAVILRRPVAVPGHIEEAAAKAFAACGWSRERGAGPPPPRRALTERRLLSAVRAVILTACTS